MARIDEQSEFDSWHRALQENKLKPKQLAVLQKMVDDGQADSLERAAQLLDWQDTVIDPLEHMYGL
jgi:hypothetical protein